MVVVMNMIWLQKRTVDFFRAPTSCSWAKSNSWFTLACTHFLACGLAFILLACDARISRLTPSTDDLGNQVFREHSGGVVSITFSPDGRFLASMDDKGILIVRDLLRNREWKRESHRSTFSFEKMLAFSPDGRSLAVDCSNDGAEMIKIWRAEEGSLINTLRTKGASRCLLFDPAGHLLSAGWTLGVTEWDPVTGKKVREFAADWHDMWIERIGLSSNGKTLVARGQKQIWIWNHETGRLVYSKGNSLMSQRGETSYRADGSKVQRDTGVSYPEAENASFYREALEEGVFSDTQMGITSTDWLVTPGASTSFSGDFPMCVGLNTEKGEWWIYDKPYAPTWFVKTHYRFYSGLNLRGEPPPFTLNPAKSLIAFAVDKEVHVGSWRELPPEGLR